MGRHCSRCDSGCGKCEIMHGHCSRSFSPRLMTESPHFFMSIRPYFIASSPKGALGANCSSLCCSRRFPWRLHASNIHRGAQLTDAISHQLYHSGNVIWSNSFNPLSPMTDWCNNATSEPPSLHVQGIDLYFKRNELLGLQPPSALPSAFAAPMPGSAPPPPYGGAGPSGGPVGAGQPQQQQQQANIFQRFTDRVAALGYTLPDVFAKHDIDKSGQLTQNQVRRRFKY